VIFKGANVSERYDVQRILHIRECLLRLFEEAKNNRLGKLAIILIVIHLQDLLEGIDIDAVAEVCDANGPLLALL
jgi:hypothetical protein